MGFKQTLFIFFMFIVFATSSCERDLHGDSGTQLSETFSIEDQTKIGNKIADAIFNNPTDFPILDKNDPLYADAYAYLQNDILEVIVKSPAMTKWKDFDWKVNILNSDEDFNAFFLPNGEFFIHVGLLKKLEHDAELIGVVAHELAYIERNLILENLKREVGANVLSELLADTPDKQVNNPSEMVLLKYESNEVLYADSFTVAAICPFSYDSKAYQKLLERFDKRSVGSVNIDWYIRKSSTEYINRENKIEDFFAKNTNCTGSGGVTRTDEYEQFIDLLPQ